jgi:hypothetical protein
MQLDQSTIDQLHGTFTYQDYQTKGVHVIKRTGRTESSIPAFATNDLQLKSVIAHAAITYIYRSKKPPEQIVDDLKYLDRLARERHSKELQIDAERWQHMEEHFAAIDSAGGYLPLLGAIAYRAWRLRWHNRDIAFSLATKPAAVQHILDKLQRIAVLLGFRTVQRSERRQAWLAKKAGVDEAIISAWKDGKTTGQIVRDLHVTPTRITNLLRWHGLYTWRKRVIRPGCKRPGMAKIWAERRGSRPPYRRSKCPLAQV